VVFISPAYFEIEDSFFFSSRRRHTIYPDSKEIEIIQERLFTVIQTEKDSALVVGQWNKIIAEEGKNVAWSKELGSFPVKSYNYELLKNKIRPHLIFNYSKEEDLRVFGIWYNKEKKQFSINNIPKHNIKTNDGQLENNYWVFSAEDKVVFTIEPFLQMPDNYKKLKKPLKELLATNEKQ
ncbi:MAG: hypothetical protein GYB37_04460, partial [Algicola sp.]|nr:hypothetical protein [Algicola sp.]